MSPRASTLKDDAAATKANLDALRDTSAANTDRLALALRLLDKDKHLDVLRAAAEVVAELGDTSARPALLAKYDWCDAQPKRRDGGGYTRAAILRALRPIATPEDIHLAQRAMVTYEQDGPFEVASDVRANGLLMLNEIQPDLATYWASRLLGDANKFSGEPARTAVRVLNAQGQTAQVYGIAVTSHNSEVVGEALRSLTDLPSPLVPGLIDLYSESEDEQILLGLYDLLIGHETRDEWIDTLTLFLRTTYAGAMYEIVVTQMVASRSERFIARLRDLADVEPDPAKRDILQRALTLA